VGGRGLGPEELLMLPVSWRALRLYPLFDGWLESSAHVKDKKTPDGLRAALAAVRGGISASSFPNGSPEMSSD